MILVPLLMMVLLILSSNNADYADGKRKVAIKEGTAGDDDNDE